MTAHVTREGTRTHRGTVEVQQRLDLETEELSADAAIAGVRCGVRLTVYSKGDDQTDIALRYGQRIRFPAKLSVPRNFRNPGAFDYGAYLAEHGISALASVKEENIESLPGFAGRRFEFWRERIRRSILNRTRLLWPTEEASLIDAMLVGENTPLGHELLTDFQRTGTYHVLVISGLKVGILAFVTFWLARRLHAGPFVAGITTVLLCVFYALLTDVGVPVWRATLMLGLYLATQALYRKRAVLNTIGCAGLILLFLDPAGLSGASFQLSFLCVLIIAAIGSPILDRTTRPLRSSIKNLDSVPYDFALPPRLAQFRLDLRMIRDRFARFLGFWFSSRVLAGSLRVLLVLAEFLAVSLILQIGFGLPMAFYFHRATIVSLPANILAVPLTQIALLAGMLALVSSYVSLPAARIPAFVAGISLHAMAGSVRWLGALRIADLRVATPGAPLVLGAGAALLLAMIAVRRRPLVAGLGLAALTASALWISFVPAQPVIQPGVLEVTSIDVGEGDATLVVSPQGETLLVDAGGIPHWMHSELDIGEDVVSPYLWSRGIQHLNAVAVTHPHADHIGGMRAVLNNFHPNQLWIGAGPANSELNALLDEASRLHIPVFSRKGGDHWQSEELAFRVLAPLAESSDSKTNDDSLVMKITYGGTSVLLEGDAERQLERRIVDEHPGADLLKVAHHGSATSTTPELLAAVHPRYAAISVGRRNVYGHPRREILERLREAHVTTYRTDLNGAVTFYLDGKNVTFHPRRR